MFRAAYCTKTGGWVRGGVYLFETRHCETTYECGGALRHYILVHLHIAHIETETQECDRELCLWSQMRG